MRSAVVCVSFVVFALAGASPAQTTRTVPATYATIQSAIAAASAGDTVLVSAGTYHEKIDFLGKAITVASVAGPDFTTIDADQTGTVVSFITGETSASILDGFTITDGLGAAGIPLGFPGAQTGQPGGIRVSNASPVIRRCKVFANHGGAGPGPYGVIGGAGGIGAQGGAMTIEDCRIEQNIAGDTGNQTGGSAAISPRPDGSGGGVTLRSASATIRRTAFIGNTGGHGCYIISGGTSGTSQGIVGAGGAGGLHVVGDPTRSVVLENCVFRLNAGGNAQVSLPTTGTVGVVANAAGAGAVSNLPNLFNTYASITLRFCTIADNAPGSVGSVTYAGIYGPMTISSSIVRGTSSVTGVVASWSTFTQPMSGAENGILDPGLIVDSSGLPRPTDDSSTVEAGNPADSAITTTDFDGQPRVRGYLPDQGAFEFAAPSRIGSKEDLIIESSLNGGTDRRSLVKSIHAGDVASFLLLSPGLTHTNRVAFLAAQFFPNGTPPYAQPGFPELLLNQNGGFILFDGFAANPSNPVGLSAAGSLTINYTLPYVIGGMSARIQAVVFNPNAANGIFVTSHAIDFQML